MCKRVVCTQDTYTSTDSSFTTQLDKAVTAFGVERLGVGLEMVNASTEERIPIQEVIWRFQEIEKAGGKEVNLCMLQCLCVAEPCAYVYACVD